MVSFPPGRRWVTSTSVTVIVDALLRKPFAVLVTSTFHTVQEMFRAPQESYIGRIR